jgi:metallo-beta-lactamase superfamily protein
MDELREKLWGWTAPHPDWHPEADWPQQVNSFAHSTSSGLFLVDPLVEANEWSAVDELAEAGGVAAVAVTVGYHERDAAEAARRYNAPLFAPLLGDERESLAGARRLRDGDRLPGAVQALVVEAGEEALLYLSGARTLVAGDLLLARDGRLSVCPASWLEREDDIGAVRDGLARALELPLEAVAVSHGEPALFEGRTALEDALRDPRPA